MISREDIENGKAYWLNSRGYYFRYGTIVRVVEERMVDGRFSGWFECYKVNGFGGEYIKYSDLVEVE
jgi:hypothetical protein